MTWKENISAYIENEIQFLISKHYGLHCNDYQRIFFGHTNIIFLCVCSEGNYVFRITNISRRIKDFSVEEKIINALNSINMPQSTHQIVPTTKKCNRVVIQCPELCALHLFSFIDGQIKYLWQEVPDSNDLQLIAKAYKILNSNLATIPVNENDRELFADLEKSVLLLENSDWIEKQAISEYLNSTIESFIEKGRDLLAYAKLFLPLYNQQYVHNDIQNENMLWCKDTIQFIDFELSTIGYEEIDVIFSAFRICKKGKSDNLLEVDRQSFYTFIGTYYGTTAILQLNTEIGYAFWKSFFALQQSLLYIENALCGLWTLDYNIGFLPCYNSVLTYNTSKLCKLHEQQ